MKVQDLTTRQIREWHRLISQEVSVYSANKALMILKAGLPPEKWSSLMYGLRAFEALGIGGPYPALVFSGLFTLRLRRRDCLKKTFCRRFVAKSHLKTALVVFDPPSINQVLCLGQSFEPVDI